MLTKRVMMVVAVFGGISTVSMASESGQYVEKILVEQPSGHEPAACHDAQVTMGTPKAVTLSPESTVSTPAPHGEYTPPAAGEGEPKAAK